MSRDCVQLFCGCEYYFGKEEQVDTKVYLAVGFMLVVVTAAVRIGSQWFIFKDYYPMKERSPVLCILMITFFAIQLILYPLVYTYNYFTFNWGEIKYAYRTIFYALDGSLYLIYLIRSLRLVYAHEIDTSRSKTCIFKFFKNEYNLVIFILVVIAIKIIPIVCADFDDDIFLTFIDVNFYTYGVDGEDISQELGFGIKQIIHEFVWLSIIIYCLWLQTLVHKKYSMKNELLMVLGIGFGFNLASIGIFISQIGELSIIRTICNMYPDYPVLQMMRDINVLGLFVISILYPLFKKRIYHMLLPTGRHHDIVKTMRDFLMQTEFIDIFTAFLQSQDQEKGAHSYVDTLEYWKKLMVIKYQVTAKLSDQQQQHCIDSIKELIQDIEERPVKDIHANLLTNLKQSILSLQECEQEVQERYRFMDEINEKIEDLQVIFLEKLDQIYKSEYRQTKSYYYLKMYILRNKKINVNMITMGMAVMVESDDTL